MPSENSIKQALGLLETYVSWQGPNIINTHKAGSPITEKLEVSHTVWSVFANEPVCFNGIAVRDVLIPNKDTVFEYSAPVHHIVHVLATAYEELHKNGQCETGIIEFDFIHAKIEEALIEIELANIEKNAAFIINRVPQEIKLPANNDTPAHVAIVVEMDDQEPAPEQTTVVEEK